MPSFSSFAQTQRTAFFICPGGAIRHKPGLNTCHCNEGSSECRVWQSLHVGRKRYTAVDTFGLVVWWSQQQVFLKVKRAHNFSRPSTRWDKGFHGCIWSGSSATFAIKFRRRSPVCFLVASWKVDLTVSLNIISTSQSPRSAPLMSENLFPSLLG